MRDNGAGHWESSRLDEICDIIRGLAFPTTDKSFVPSDGTIACLRTTNVQREVEWDDLWFIPTKHVRNEAQIVRPGDILISTANSFELVGKVAQVKEMPHRATLGAFISLIRPSELLNRSFVFYQLSSNEVQRAIRAMASTTTNISNVSTGKLRDLDLRVAPRPEQDRIVAEIEKQFTRLDAATAALKRVQANLKRYRASVLKAACEGRLVPTEAELARKEGRNYEPADQLLQRILRERRARWEADTLAKMIASGKPPKDDRWKEKYKEPVPPDTTNLPNLPEGWCWASLDQLFVVERGRFSIRPRNDPRYYDGAFPFVQIGDLPREGGIVSDHRQTLNGRGLQVSKMFIAGTILVAIVGATIGNTGILSFDACCPDSLVALQSEETSLLVFAEYYLRLKKDELRGSSYASGGQPNINLAYLCPFPVPLPPRMEQVRILEELDRHFSALSRVSRAATDQENRARSLRSSVLKHAFCGKLIAQEPADEPASALLACIRAEQDQGKSRKRQEEAACV